MGVGTPVGMKRSLLWHGAIVALLVVTFPRPGMAAAPSAEVTIDSIQTKAETAISWIESRTVAYQTFLSKGPTVSAATAERDRAILEMYAKAAQTQLEIYALMAQHPGDTEVAAAGQEAIAAVYEAASEESQMTRELCDEFVAASLSAETTTTTVATAAPPPTTTSTTLPGASTTSTTTPAGHTTTTAAADLTTTTSVVSNPVTTAANQSSPVEPISNTTQPSSGPDPSPPGTGADSDPAGEGPVNQSTSELAVRLISGGIPAGLQRANLDGTGESAVSIEDALELRVLRTLIRLSVPAAIGAPLVDLALLLRAVVAAFVSGMATLAWPAGTLSASLFLYGIWRRIRRI
jgi:hypothetical protein